MRARVKVVAEGGSKIGYDYQYALASALYRKLEMADPQSASALHAYRGFRHYCFSGIAIKEGSVKETGLLLREGDLIVSSPSPDFLKPFLEGLLMDPELNLNGSSLNVESIEILPELKFDKPVVRLRTLSPIFVKTMRDVDGRLVEWELYPSDGKFYENLSKNLLERCRSYFGTHPADAHFQIRKLHWTKPKRVNISGTPRRCSLMEFDLEASSELTRFAYDAGLGEKNAMGFGCVEVVG